MIEWTKPCQYRPQVNSFEARRQLKCVQIEKYTEIAYVPKRRALDNDIDSQLNEKLYILLDFTKMFSSFEFSHFNAEFKRNAFELLILKSAKTVRFNHFERPGSKKAIISKIRSLPV